MPRDLDLLAAKMVPMFLCTIPQLLAKVFAGWKKATSWNLKLFREPKDPKLLKSPKRINLFVSAAPL